MSIVSQGLQRQAEQFLFYEARLLDEQRLEEWNDLFTEDGAYWIPSLINQKCAVREVSHMYEKRMIREIRIRRHSAPNAPSMSPTPRSSHMISSVLCEAGELESNVLVVSSRFIVHQFQRDQMTVFAGQCVHQLLEVDGGLKIKEKRVNLINCDGMLGDLVVYL